MDRLRQRELRATLDFLRDAYACSDLHVFQTCVVSTLPRLVHCDITAYNLIQKRFEIVSCPSLDTLPDGPKILAWFAARYAQLPQKHPLIAYYHRTGDGSAVKISDFLTQREFHRTELFYEVFRPVRMEYQMAIEVHTPPDTTIGTVVMRNRCDFSERERLMMNLVLPHLVQAYRNARAAGRMRRQLTAMSETVERLPFGVIMLDRDGRVSMATPRAREALARFFDTGGGSGDRLPPELAQWIRHEEAKAGAVDLYRPRRPFVAKREDRRLMVRVLLDAEPRLLLLEEHETALHPGMLQSLGLTAREAQVLVDVIREKTNREIAGRLGMSPRTVATHLDHIFYKFGVATRTAAARYALDATIARGGQDSAPAPNAAPEGRSRVGITMSRGGPNGATDL